MPGSVGDVGDEVHVFAFAASQQAVDGVDDDPDEVDVFPLVEATYVVGLGCGAFVEDEVDGAGMVFDVEPVAYVLSFAVDGERLAMAYVVDEKGYEFLGELVGTVVVGAVGYYRGHAVGVVVGAYEVVARCFAGRIGAVGVVFGLFVEKVLAVGQMMFRRRGGCRKRGLDAFGMGHFQRAVDFVGGDVVEAFAFVSLGE